MTAEDSKNSLLGLLEDINKNTISSASVSPKDFITLVELCKVLVTKAYEDEIQLEESEKIHEQIMSEMDPWDFT